MWKGSSYEQLRGIAGDGNASPGVLAAGQSSKVWVCLVGFGGCNEYSQTVSANFSSVTSNNAGGGFLAGATDGKIYQSGDNAAFSSIFSTGWSAVSGIWGSTEFLAVGTGGGIAHGDSQSNWALQTSGTTQDLFGVYGIYSADASIKNYYAVGRNGTILFSAGGGSWSPQTSNTTALLNAVWASGLNDVYAVGSDGAGNGVIMHLK
jgi:hypothetical protein